jgi:DNA-directed RNA polymerase specialized sigma24 family protein
MWGCGDAPRRIRNWPRSRPPTENSWRRFLRLATAITGDEQAAYDAVRDAFVRAVRYRGRLRDHEASPGWVCRIVINEARKRSSVERRLLEPHGG